MAAKKATAKLRLQTGIILQILVGVLFLLMGIAGITDYNSDFAEIGRSVSQAFGGDSEILDIIIAVVELACGIVLIATVFAKVDKKLVKLAQLISMILWILLIVLLDILAPNFGANRFDWLVWGQTTVLHLIVLLSIYSMWNGIK
ncbi:MAG: hypothetical protein HQ557_14915 [Bacteroidetes bacterium]|nr:hypothetical protein [Bacteroidota bacterium]